MSEEPYPIVTPDDDGIRPAGAPDACFYCGSKVGERHGPNCVTVRSERLLEVKILIRSQEPRSWSADDIEFKYNLGTWCGDNIVDKIAEEVERLDTEGTCLCGALEVRVVEPE